VCCCASHAGLATADFFFALEYDHVVVRFDAHAVFTLFRRLASGSPPGDSHTQSSQKHAQKSKQAAYQLLFPLAG